MGRPVGTTVYSVDDDFFSVSDPLNSYWAGLLAADGCLVSGRNAVKLTQARRGKPQLETFKLQTGFDGPVTHDKHEMYTVTVYSRRWRQDLERNFSLTERKTATLQPPVGLQGDNVWGFIAGYIDGDGWLSWRLYRDWCGQKLDVPRLTIGCLGTQDMLNWIASHFDSVAPTTRVPAKPFPRNNGRIFQYAVSGSRSHRVRDRVMQLSIPKYDYKWNTPQW